MFSCPADELVKNMTAPISASDGNLTTNSWFTNVSQFSPVLPTQRLSAVGTPRENNK
jgi:hypothetical protein